MRIGCGTSGKEQVLLDKATIAGKNIQTMSMGGGIAIFTPDTDALKRSSDGDGLSAIFCDKRICLDSFAWENAILIPCYLSAVNQRLIVVNEKWNALWRIGNSADIFGKLSEKERDDMMQSAMIER
jgi:hypothetical protein